jgi:hypothetical protein
METMSRPTTYLRIIAEGMESVGCKHLIKDKYPKIVLKAVPKLRRLVTGFSPRSLGFSPRTAHIGFVVGESDNGADFSSSLLRFPQLSLHQCSILSAI